MPTNPYQPPGTENRRAKTVIWLTVALAIANVTAWWIDMYSLGGSALYGMIDNGRYYVGMEGRLTQVNRIAYILNLAHHISIYVLGIAAAIGLGVAYGRAKQYDPNAYQPPRTDSTAKLWLLAAAVGLILALAIHLFRLLIKG